MERTEKTIPCNVDAERAVLGALLIDQEVILKVGEILKSEDFYRERHGWLYDAIMMLASRGDPLDTVTLCDELERRGQLDELGGPAYIVDLLNATPTAIYAEHYARIVERAAGERRLIAAANQIAELAYNEEDELPQKLDKAEQMIFAVHQGRDHRSMRAVSDVLQEYVAHISELASDPDRAIGLPTGFTMLDRMLGGLHPSDLIVLAARPGMGKSSLALSVAANAAKQHQARVAIFSLEMSSEQMVGRLLSMETAIDSHRLRMGALEDEEWTMIMEASNLLSARSIFIDDTPAVSSTDIRTKARRLYAERGLDMIIIDYLQLMTGPSFGRSNDNRQQEISLITRSLKALARELNVPVIALSQLSRAVEGRADKRPMLSDLRESGAIEQDSDIVLFIYRDDYYNEDSDKQNIADVIVAKHRHGCTGTVSLYFRKELTQFRDLDIQRTDLNY